MITLQLRNRIVTRVLTSGSCLLKEWLGNDSANFIFHAFYVSCKLYVRTSVMYDVLLCGNPKVNLLTILHLIRNIILNFYFCVRSPHDIILLLHFLCVAKPRSSCNAVLRYKDKFVTSHGKLA